MTDRAELQLTAFPPVPALLGPSQLAHRARSAFQRAANATGPVLIVAEPGLDPLAVARALHEASPRAAGSFSSIDCAAAHAQRIDGVLVRLAAASTQVMLNVDALPQLAQAQLARALGDFPLGVLASVGHAEQNLPDARLSRDLHDCFVDRIDIPPLRHRPADIPTLIGCLLGECASAVGVPVPSFSREALTLLAALPWRRNLDELRDALDVLARAAVGSTIRLEDILEHIPLEPLGPGQPATRSLREARLSFERHYIASVLNRHPGRMADAARSLGIQRTNLYRKVRQLGIAPARTRPR